MANNISREMDGLGTKYHIIEKPDLDSLAKLLDLARGTLSIQSFAGKSCVSCTTLYSISEKKRKRNVAYHHLVSIMEAADTESGVTLSALMAANGMIPCDQEVIASLDEGRKELESLPETKSVSGPSAIASSSRKKNKIVEYTNPKDYGDDKKNFSKNLAHYMKGKNSSKLGMVHDKKSRLYSSVEMRILLNNNHKKEVEAEEQRKKEIKEFYRNCWASFPKKYEVKERKTIDSIIDTVPVKRDPGWPNESENNKAQENGDSVQQPLSESVKRKPGRPKGSKNKPKSTVAETI